MARARKKPKPQRYWVEVRIPVLFQPKGEFEEQPEFPSREPVEFVLIQHPARETLARGEVMAARREGERFQKILGLRAQGGGTGFGYRELRYYDQTKSEAETLTQKAAFILEEMGYAVGDVEGMAQVLVYPAPKQSDPW